MSKYTDAVEHRLQGLHAVSTGLCPGCEECARDMGYEDQAEFAADYQSGKCESEPSFSWRDCGICGSRLGSEHEPWHWLDENNEIRHEDDACPDCIIYLANGDEPTED